MPYEVNVELLVRGIIFEVDDLKEMSFKRDGDDLTLLDNLQQRRVSELLAANIPSDEARLLKNGRYTCTICHCQPIFDTLEILAIHRKGKKHLKNLSSILIRQSQINVFNEPQSKCSVGLENISSLTQMKKSSSPDNNRSKQKCHLLLKSAPYNSRSKRKTNPLNRKFTIDLRKKSQPASDLPNTCTPSTTSSFTQYFKSLQQKRSFEDVVEMSRNLCNSLSTDSLNHSTDFWKDTHSPAKKPLSLNTLSEQDRIKANYQLNLYRDGWKKDADGKWVKDEQAEFDSDDETPLDT